MFVTLRLDCVSHAEENVKEWLQKWLKDNDILKYVVYREEGDVTKKIHLQGYIECDKLQYQGLVKDFRDTFSKTHSRYERSFTPVRKVESYIRYVAKDKNLVYQQGYTEEYIQKNEEESYKVDIKEKKSFNDILWQEFAEIRQSLEDKYYRNIQQSSKHEAMAEEDSAHYIANFIHDWLLENHKSLRKLQYTPTIQKYVQTFTLDIIPVSVMSRIQRGCRRSLLE